jgi:hypothetical protein
MDMAEGARVVGGCGGKRGAEMSNHDTDTSNLYANLPIERRLLYCARCSAWWNVGVRCPVCGGRGHWRWSPYQERERATEAKAAESPPSCGEAAREGR